MRSEPTAASSLYSSISRGPVDGVRYLRESIGGGNNPLMRGGNHPVWGGNLPILVSA
jgi:hypothetical protein